MRNLYLIVIFLTWISFPVFPQATADTIIPASQPEFFDAIYGVDQRLISGDFYYEPLYNTIQVTGHPFLIDEKWKPGKVKINGIEYDNLEIRLDIADNKVIVRFTDIYGSDLQLCLKNEDIEWVSINDQIIQPIEDKRINFYELHSAGSISYLVLREKRLIEGTGRVSSDYVYFEYVRQYIKNEGKLIHLKGIKTLYKLLPQYKTQIKDFKKKNKIVFSQNNHEGVGRIISFCNELLSDK